MAVTQRALKVWREDQQMTHMKDCQKHRLIVKPSVNTNQGDKRWRNPGPFLREATGLGTSWANSWASEALESISQDWVLSLSINCNPNPKGLFLEASLGKEHQTLRAEACHLRYRQWCPHLFGTHVAHHLLGTLFTGQRNKSLNSGLSLNSYMKQQWKYKMKNFLGKFSFTLFPTAIG